jgi:hypothetical protein
VGLCVVRSGERGCSCGACWCVLVVLVLVVLGVLVVLAGVFWWGIYTTAFLHERVEARLGQPLLSVAVARGHPL